MGFGLATGAQGHGEERCRVKNGNRDPLRECRLEGMGALISGELSMFLIAGVSIKFSSKIPAEAFRNTGAQMKCALPAVCGRRGDSELFVVIRKQTTLAQDCGDLNPWKYGLTKISGKAQWARC